MKYNVYFYNFANLYMVNQKKKNQIKNQIKNKSKSKSKSKQKKYRGNVKHIKSEIFGYENELNQL